MNNRNSGDLGKKETLDPADRRTACLPVPKTGIRRHRGAASPKSIRLECLSCTILKRLIDDCHHAPDMIDALLLSDFVHRLPQLLGERLLQLLQHQFAGNENNGFPCPLPEILRDKRLLSLFHDRLATTENLQDLITDPPAILLDEYQELFFYRSVSVMLRPISFSYLLLLAQTPEKYVRRETIFQHLWPDAANYEGTNKPYEGQVSDHKRKLIAAIKQGVTGKAAIEAGDVDESGLDN
ncbi:MAG: helix-turn-helix domain-containing protein [Syntrophobacterales bacterium]|nr:helix-turn-helix domain-containing protein [Syntrophobacterales bacterium]